jgi:hypothetical protein
MVHYSPDAYYRLAASIDLSGVHWSVAVIPSFEGSFDGNNLTISHLTITGADYLGLFGRLASGAEVKNLGIVNVSITGSGGCFGGLVGYNYGGTVTQCYSTGIVSGDGLVGGLVGINGGSITTSYSTGAVSGNFFVGGLVGSNWGDVTQCYSIGAVTGTEDFVGGLVGSGSPDYVTASFWDFQTSGLPIPFSAGGTAKTTAEMQTAKTFLDAGWDFVGETANGTEDIWWIDEGKDYPRLWWQAAPE